MKIKAIRLTRSAFTCHVERSQHMWFKPWTNHVRYPTKSQWSLKITSEMSYYFSFSFFHFSLPFPHYLIIILTFQTQNILLSWSSHKGGRPLTDSTIQGRNSSILELPKKLLYQIHKKLKHCINKMTWS